MINVNKMDRRISRIERALVLLSEVTPGKTAGSYAEWEEFVKLIGEIGERVEGARKAVNSPDS